MNELSDFQKAALDLFLIHEIVTTAYIKGTKYIYTMSGYILDEHNQIDIHSTPWENYVMKINGKPMDVIIEHTHDLFYKEFEAKSSTASLLRTVIMVGSEEFSVLKGNGFYYYFSKLYSDLYVDYENCSFAVNDDHIYVYDEDYTKILFIMDSPAKTDRWFW